MFLPQKLRIVFRFLNEIIKQGQYISLTILCLFYKNKTNNHKFYAFKKILSLILKPFGDKLLLKLAKKNKYYWSINGFIYFIIK